MAKEVFTTGLNLGKGAVQGEAKAQVEAIQAKLDVLERSSNPQSAMAQVKEVIALLKELQPTGAASAGPAGSGSEDRVSRLIDDFMKREAGLQAQITQMNSERVASLERQLESLRQAPQAQAAAAPKDDLASTLNKILDMKDKIQDAFGGGQEEKEEKVPLWMTLAQTAMAGLPALATAILGASYNMAIAKTGAGQPISPIALPNPAPGTPGTGALPAGGAGDSPGPGQSPQPPPGGMGAQSPYLAFLRQIEHPFINHLNDPSKNGADFASWVTDGYGDIGYQAAKEMGKDALYSLLMSYPPIAQVIQQIPERADAFLEEFIHADESDNDNGQEDEPQPAETPRSVVDISPAAARRAKRAQPVQTPA
jgi:hypothetical protein